MSRPMGNPIPRSLGKREGFEKGVEENIISPSGHVYPSVYTPIVCGKWEISKESALLTGFSHSRIPDRNRPPDRRLGILLAISHTYPARSSGRRNKKILHEDIRCPSHMQYPECGIRSLSPFNASYKALSNIIARHLQEWGELRPALTPFDITQLHVEPFSPPLPSRGNGVTGWGERMKGNRPRQLPLCRDIPPTQAGLSWPARYSRPASRSAASLPQRTRKP